MVPKDIRARYDKLKKSVNYYRTLYHVYDREEISQAALDSLKHELSEIEKQYPAIIAPDSPRRGETSARIQKGAPRGRAVVV